MNEIKSLGNGTIIAFRFILIGWQNIFTRQKKFLSMPILAGENLLAVMNLSHRDTKQGFDSSDERNLSIMTGELLAWPWKMQGSIQVWRNV